MTAGTPSASPPPPGRRTVLVVDDDPVLANLVQAILTDEGYLVSVLTTVASDAIRTAVGRLEPDCVLLDSRGPADYGASWLDAAWAHARAGRPRRRSPSRRPCPTPHSPPVGVTSSRCCGPRAGDGTTQHARDLADLARWLGEPMAGPLSARDAAGYSAANRWRFAPQTEEESAAAPGGGG